MTCLITVALRTYIGVMEVVVLETDTFNNSDLEGIHSREIVVVML